MGQDPIFQEQPLQVDHREELQKRHRIRQDQEREKYKHSKNKRKNDHQQNGTNFEEIEEEPETHVPAQQNISLSRWVLSEACKLMEEYLKLGTELNIYNVLEYESIYWYLSHIYFYHSNILSGIESEVQKMYILE